MNRIMTVAVTLLFAGVALAGCTGGNNGGGGGGGGDNTAPPQAVVTASPLSPKVGEQVSFTASQAKSGDDAQWQFGDGATGTGASATHTYSAPGQYIVLLTLSNDQGNSTNDAALTYITVTPAPLELANITNATAPFAQAAASTQVVQAGGTVQFDASGSGAWEANPEFDPSDPVQSPAHNAPFASTGEVTYAWDFGDNATGGNTTGAQVNHTFSKPGLYPVKLTVTSTAGQSSSYYVTVRVLPQAPPATGVRNPSTFITATIGEPESLDPGYDYESAGGAILEQVYEKLYDYPRDRADQVVPRVAAEQPQVSANGTEVTIKIRQGIKFHDGTDLTAEDVKFSIDRLILMNDPDGPSWIYTVIAGADKYHSSDSTAADRTAYLAAGGITVVDPQTVKFKLDFPDPAFKFKLAFYATSIVSKDYVCAHAEPDFVDCLPPPGETRHPWMDTHEAGSGPFMLDTWIPGQQIILKRFDQYWDNARKPKVEKVIIQKVEDINTRLLMLFSGQADDVYIPVDHADDVIGKANVRIVENPSWTVGFIGFNQKFCGGSSDPGFQTCMTANGGDAPKGANGQPAPDFFADVNMRKAFTLAFDYDTYYNDILDRHGEILNGPLPKGIFGYDESIPKPKQDMAAAVEAFKKTNHTGGFALAIYFNTGNTVREQTAALYAQNLEEMCQQAGATCDVKSQGLDWSTAFLPKQRARALPMFYLGWAPDYAYPDNYAVTFAHSEKGVYSKRVGYVNTELDAMMDDLADEFDEAKAKAGWSTVVKELNEDYVFLWLAQSANYHVERDWVKGYYYNPMHSGGPNIGDYTAVSKG